MLLYLSLREAAHQRLFAHVPWLRQHLISSVEDFGRGVTIDISGIEQAMGQLDPTNMEAMQEALQGGLFEPQQTPEQKAALVRLETTLALVEGWVDEVVGQATAERMPAAGKMQEAIRRRRAAGGPAEETFAALVGLELRPRRLRDASTLWGSLRSRQGKEARDAVWAHPDLLPTAADLDDPLGFREDLPEVAELSDEDFDKAIGQLLDREAGTADDEDEGDEGDDTDRAARVTLYDDAVDVLTHWQAPTDEQELLRASYVTHLRVHRDGLWRSCFPDHLTAGALVVSHDRPARAAQPAPQGRALVPLRRSPRGRPTLAAAALREATEESGLDGAASLDAEPLHLSRHPVEFCDPRGTVRHLDVRFLARTGADVDPVVSEESLDVRWWPVDDLPTDEPDMLEMLGQRWRRSA